MLLSRDDQTSTSSHTVDFLLVQPLPISLAGMIQDAGKCIGFVNPFWSWGHVQANWSSPLLGKRRALALVGAF